MEVFSVYKNLKSIAVNKGDEVFTKDLIGEITTDSANGQTVLNFSIFKDAVKLKIRHCGYIKCNLNK